VTEQDGRPAGVIDALCNSFLPERRQAWEESIAGQGLSIKIRSDPDDSFAEPQAMVTRMDELGIETVVVAAADVHAHPTPFQVSSVMARYGEAADQATAFPGRFAALWSIEPHLGAPGVKRLEEVLEQPWVVGAYLHTHSFDRPFDHADLYPFYAACLRAGVPMVMQAGASGGNMPSACGRPVGIDRPALYFPELSFVLSHTGWPWEAEALAMAQKHANVFMSTASWPPRRWPDNLVRFASGPGSTKVLFATNFPTVGHRQALGQIGAVGLPEEALDQLLCANARRVFSRLGRS